jgi:hypothetical protein
LTQTEGEAVLCDEGHAGVEADLRPAEHHGVVGEPRVEMGVVDDRRLILEDRVSAEGDLSRHLLGLETDPGLEPLPVAVDQADGGDRGLGDRRREPHDAVEVRVGRCVEDLAALQGGDSVLLVGGQRRRLHWNPVTCFPR